MKKILALFMVLLLLGGCASKDTIKTNENALKNLSVDGNYTVYFQSYLQQYDGKGNLIKNNEKTDSTFTYPAVFTDDMDPQSMEFTTDKNELFKEMIQEFVDLKDNLKQVEELSFDENNLAIFFENLDNDAMIYFYNDGKVKEVTKDGQRSYYKVDDETIFKDIADDFADNYYELEVNYIYNYDASKN